ncbi:hypothetical protein ACFSHQ_18900 [Gemmobacter lanyuensis]
MRFLPLAFVLFALPAQAWTEPPRGSAERRAMMDAMRPLAEWDLGAPIEFIVQSLRVEGRSPSPRSNPNAPVASRSTLPGRHWSNATGWTRTTWMAPPCRRFCKTG